MSDHSHFKSRLAAAEFRHELDMKRRGYVVTRNGRSEWVASRKPFKKQATLPWAEVFWIVCLGTLLMFLMMP